jgi:hypothetical protein
MPCLISAALSHKEPYEAPIPVGANKPAIRTRIDDPRCKAAGASGRGELDMSALAPTLESFFTQRLAAQRGASPRMVAAYRDAWRLLLIFARDRRKGALPPRLR